jgi:hypothetical protein
MPQTRADAIPGLARWILYIPPMVSSARLVVLHHWEATFTFVRLAASRRIYVL